MAKQHDGLSDYRRAGHARLADALELLERPTGNGGSPDALHRHLRGAVYLAGYAVECALKVCIISRAVGAETLLDAMLHFEQDGQSVGDLLGSDGHRLPHLRRAAEVEPLFDGDPVLVGQWEWCQKWSPDWRYHPQPYTDRGSARKVVSAAEVLYEALLEQARQKGAM